MGSGKVRKEDALVDSELVFGLNGDAPGHRCNKHVLRPGCSARIPPQPPLPQQRNQGFFRLLGR